MRAVRFVDGAVTWQSEPDPSPGRGEVLIRVKAAGLNAADLHQRAGRYRPSATLSTTVPGLEIAGEIVAIGPGTSDATVGDRVMALVGGGGQAELAIADVGCTIPIPTSMSWVEAGGFPEAFTTAHDALFTQCGLSPGERLCVHGAAGGVGVAAVQLGSVAGCGVVATVRDPARREAVSELGALAIAPEDFSVHGPFDVVIELVGVSNLAEDIASLKVGGRVSIIGVGSGSRAEIDFRRLMTVRGRLHGSTLRTRRPEEKATAVALVRRHVLPLLEQRRLAVPISAAFPISDAAAAYASFERGGKFGKIVLVSD